MIFPIADLIAGREDTALLLGVGGVSWEPDWAPSETNSIVAQAMQAQLGLKLDAKKAPVEMLVIDHLDKTPTEN
jgi:uncharacterized protein (TIGR03435 family)